ncbi:MAG: hypothetical protein ACYDDF_00590 [Thermoplasmatota archaeon]
MAGARHRGPNPRFGPTPKRISCAIAIILGALLALTLSAGLATAHITAYTEAQTYTHGTASLFVNPAPTPLYAGMPFNWTVYAGNGTGLDPVRDANITLRVTGGPAAVGTATSFTPDPHAAPGYYLAPGIFPKAGQYNLSFRVQPTNGSAYTLNGSFRAYETVLRVLPDQPTLDVFTNQSTTITFDTKAASGALVQVRDLEVRMQHWNDAHTLIYATWYQNMTSTPNGQASFTRTFNTTGMVHMQFASASLGFGFEDTPVLHMYIVNPLPSDPAQNRLPFPSVAATLAALAVAFAAVLVVRGRP